MKRNLTVLLVLVASASAALAQKIPVVERTLPNGFQALQYPDG